MSDLYRRIDELCKSRGSNITEMCRSSGASRGSLTDLKMGRITGLNVGTLEKIAAYFEVSVDHLLGKEDIKKAPTPEGEREIENQRIIEKLDSNEELRAAVLRFLGM